MQTRSWTFESLKKHAVQSGSELVIPRFESTGDEIRSAVTKLIEDGEQRIERIAGVPASQISWENSFGAREEMDQVIELTANRIYLLQYTSPQSDLRAVASEESLRMQNWLVGIPYRENLYRALKTAAGQLTNLSGERQLLKEEMMRDYHRSGMDAAPEVKARVEALKKELAEVSTKFSDHIREAKQDLFFSKDQLRGLPDNLLEQMKQTDGRYKVSVHITYQVLQVQDLCEVEETRKQVNDVGARLAQVENTPLLDRMLKIRAEIADLLGYRSWADYQTEVKMVGSEQRAQKFVRELIKDLEPKFQQEISELKKMKAAHLGISYEAVQIHPWDVRFYTQKYLREKFSVDHEALRVFFPYEKVREGVFGVYSDLFGIKFEVITDAPKWDPNVQCFALLDQESDRLIGVIYLDPFPREGKYNHFAHFGMVSGCRLSNGKYRRPMSCLVCNFPTPSATEPGLMTHDHVETFFHEFGHAMHSLLTQAETVRFSGTGVKGDFVEVPSQILEAWALDKKVLDRFARDYRDPSKTLDEALLKRMREAKRATSALHYRRQLAFALADLEFHTTGPKERSSQAIYNRVVSEVFLPTDPATNRAASWGHMTGYDGGYYGYAWADVIQCDMRSVFSKAPGGLLDREKGRELREKVLSVGGSKHPDEVVKDFLGREWNMKAFLDELGVAA